MTTVTIYGPGGFDPQEVNDNVIDEYVESDTSTPDDGYRTATYFDDTANTPTSPVGPGDEGHWYEINDQDVNKFLIIQRDAPFDPQQDVGADKLFIRVRPGFGEIGDVVEFSYVSSPVEGLDNPDISEVATILDDSVEAIVFPYSYLLDENDDPVAGAAIFGDSLTSLAEGLKWKPTGPARMTKIVTFETDLDGELADAIPVDVWTLEIHSLEEGEAVS